ncbi:hypothetical protein GCM10023317_09440 [Actinopolymorpha pittospori]|uniref:Uncharacterized protein n=1 Tax=Actinopolymorpha pittospori TaxID=648752 RepID=A0A927RKU4_9ACTN|nr:hypothetical protein [Actinopolymorpha pittospori]
MLSGDSLRIWPRLRVPFKPPGPLSSMEPAPCRHTGRLDKHRQAAVYVEHGRPTVGATGTAPGDGRGTLDLKPAAGQGFLLPLDRGATIEWQEVR